MYQIPMQEEITIIEAKTPQEYQCGMSLFQEYLAYVGLDLGFQEVEKELQLLDQQYGRPTGVLLLVSIDQEYQGCVGVRDKGEGVCELKRMYLKPACRGKRVGKRLLAAAIRIATDLGYQKMRLDTLASMLAANRLYKGAGFYEIPAYYYNPLENVKYYEREL
ncbi:MAG: GNAT family N-acetyltransferase [Bacteroidota bacterium]